MAQVRQHDTVPEVLLRRLMWAVGLMYRVNYWIEGVRADIAFAKQHLAIFVEVASGTRARYTIPSPKIMDFGMPNFAKIEHAIRSILSDCRVRVGLSCALLPGA
jgi:hypothetical protein